MTGHCISNLPTASAVVQISPGDPARLGSLDPALPRAALMETGAVLLRGYAWDVGLLAEFVRALVPLPIVYGGSRSRITQDDHIQKVEQGSMAISLHCELAFTPFRPDVCVFACVRPPAQGGETLVGDGARVLQSLSEATRARFWGPRAITYQRLFPPSAWQRTFGTSSRTAVEAALDRLGQVRAVFSNHGTLSCHFTTAAIVNDLAGRPAFANNVSNMVEAEGITGSTVTYADGTALDRETRAELRACLAQVSAPVAWQPFDVLVLDNWRVMHGRNAFTDPEREIYAHFGNLRDTTLRPSQLLARRES